MIDIEAFSCEELVELVTDYLEGALSPGDLQRFEQHISGCADCTRYLEQLRMTIRVTGTLTISDLSPEVEETLVDVFREWSNQSQAPGSTRSDP